MTEQYLETYQKLHTEFYQRCRHICEILLPYDARFETVNRFQIFDDEDRVYCTCTYEEWVVASFDKNLLFATDDEINDYGAQESYKEAWETVDDLKNK